MRVKAPKKPQRAKCPECRDRSLIIRYSRVNTDSCELLDNGVDGRSIGSDYSEGDLDGVSCSSCQWESDAPEAFVDKLLNRKRKVNNART